jgi:hypothetical protein
MLDRTQRRTLHRDDAARFLQTVLREEPDIVKKERNDVWVPKVVAAYLRKTTGEPIAEDDPSLFEFYPAFHDAAWDLARQGVLRPSAIYPDGVILPMGVQRGAGYCLTEAGRARLAELADQPWVPVDPSRYSEALKRFSGNLGPGFEQRSYEAARSKLAAAASLSRDGWTAQEVEVMADHRWWSLDELAQTPATVWPENLLAMLNAAKSR